MTGSVTTLTRRRLLAIAVVVVAAPKLGFAAGPRIEAWRSPACGCCEGWADHLRRAGYGVTLHDAPDLAAVRARLSVPRTSPAATAPGSTATSSRGTCPPRR